ncbi:ribonuclease P protein component [Meridianimarinicoccus sp. RP-17]|uniref:ribonuclease P protein component n=1 Tax=Meridianimarinicoccus zhengii TaxID=2056810 RepID=UPI000DABDFC7|nr:ribonuclease P protein component [Phycocomes zhengii]
MAGPQVPGDTQTDRAAPQGDGAFPVETHLQLQTLTRRADFLAAARARHRATSGFIVQARARREDETAPEALRVGFTCSKKVGNAVARNRVKRRLRALARSVLPAHGQRGWDYVLIGRSGVTATRDFAVMQADLADALDRLHGTGAP